AVPTSCAPSARASSNWSRSAASGSSSAIRTRNGFGSAIRLDRHCERNLELAVVHRAIAASRAVAPSGFEPLADVAEAKAGAFVGRGGQFFLAAVLQA